jgi:hypothetical protein
LARRRCSTSRRDLTRDKGNDHGMAQGTWERTRAHSGQSGEHDRGHNASAEALEGVEHGAMVPRRHESTPASNRAMTRAINKEIGARRGCSPREETLESRGNGGGAGRLGATVAELRLHRKNSGEHGLGGPEGLGENRGTFQVAAD